MAEGGVTRVPSPPDRVVVSGPFPVLDPPAMWRIWTEPALLTRWWPTEASLDLREGGSYHFVWPAMDWHLRGTFLTVEPERLLRFTWSWDHDDLPQRTVAVNLDPLLDGGTRLTVEHGTYSDSATDVEDRDSHLAGWLHFLGRLYMISPELAELA
jgi:uncharacterized protein YndB with AHSA1/START domain